MSLIPSCVVLAGLLALPGGVEGRPEQPMVQQANPFPQIKKGMRREVAERILGEKPQFNIFLGFFGNVSSYYPNCRVWVQYDVDEVLTVTPAK